MKVVELLKLFIFKKNIVIIEKMINPNEPINGVAEIWILFLSGMSIT